MSKASELKQQISDIIYESESKIKNIQSVIDIIQDNCDHIFVDDVCEKCGQEL